MVVIYQRDGCHLSARWLFCVSTMAAVHRYNDYYLLIGLSRIEVSRSLLIRSRQAKHLSD